MHPWIDGTPKYLPIWSILSILALSASSPAKMLFTLLENITCDLRKFTCYPKVIPKASRHLFITWTWSSDAWLNKVIPSTKKRCANSGLCLAKLIPFCLPSLASFWIIDLSASCIRRTSTGRVNPLVLSPLSGFIQSSFSPFHNTAN